MDIKGSFKKYGNTISYCITDEQKDKIIERLLKFYSVHSYFGESLHQDDNSIIEAPTVLSDICDDIIEFLSDEESEDDEDDIFRDDDWIHDPNMDDQS